MKMFLVITVLTWNVFQLSSGNLLERFPPIQPYYPQPIEPVVLPCVNPFGIGSSGCGVYNIRICREDDYQPGWPPVDDIPDVRIREEIVEEDSYDSLQQIKYGYNFGDLPYPFNPLNPYYPPRPQPDFYPPFPQPEPVIYGGGGVNWMGGSGIGGIGGGYSPLYNRPGILGGGTGSPSFQQVGGSRSLDE